MCSWLSVQKKNLLKEQKVVGLCAFQKKVRYYVRLVEGSSKERLVVDVIDIKLLQNWASMVLTP